MNKFKYIYIYIFIIVAFLKKYEILILMSLNKVLLKIFTFRKKVQNNYEHACNCRGKQHQRL